MEYTSADEVAVCNLASISLPKFVDKQGVFDYEQLIVVTK
jgi:ribonucleotide reductase alpha subunit